MNVLFSLVQYSRENNWFLALLALISETNCLDNWPEMFTLKRRFFPLTPN